MKIGELAEWAKCQTVTIRYYEKIGLFNGNGRDGSNHRVYDGEAAERLRFILHCRNHGVPISDIKVLLDLRAGSAQKGVGVVDILRKHIENLKNRRDSLDQLIKSLTGLLAGADEADGGEILAALGSPCPHCSDYEEKTKKGTEGAKRAACLANPEIRRKGDVFK